METGTVGNNQRGITITVYFSVQPLEENWIVQWLIAIFLKTRQGQLNATFFKYLSLMEIDVFYFSFTTV
jgi:hypothetical protein